MALSDRVCHCLTSSFKLLTMYCSNWAMALALKVWETTLRLRVCSARLRVLKTLRAMETNAV